MTRGRGPGGGTRGSVLASALGAALLATALPVSLVPSLAAWTDREWVHAPTLGTDRYDCGSDDAYATAASGTFLSGTVGGADLSAVAGVPGVSAARSGSEPATVTPDTASHVDAGDADTGTDTYANPLTVDAVGIDVLALSGLNAGLPVGSIGVLNQYAQVTNTGYSAGASGLITDSGAVAVAPTSPDLPEPATIDLAGVLPEGLAGARLTVGAVAASSQLDWCAASESAAWGDGSVTGSTREYGIASLGLVLDSPIVVSLTADVRAGIASMLADSSTLNLGAGSPVDTLLSATLTGSGLSIDLARGTISVDLESLLTDDLGLNGRAANTALTLDPARVAAVAAQTEALLAEWSAAVTAELRAVVPAILPTGGLIGPVLSATNRALNLITAELTATVSALTATLETTVGGAAVALTGFFDALPGVLSLTVNVQPDQPGAPPGAPFTAATPPDDSAQYRVSALRVGLLNHAVAGAELAVVNFATASAGSNTRLP